ncbi:conserved hypothetical protein [Verticillium alfalfae VaMs.102]|uniref:Uncharacterized protein n=1 Tax=Verticillium alfalfae (strain VaMs.102 / ATCC MYA-4576 / FGSC 10136) TaxID=526221 RepID=C9SI64_VERA1|nr:conserved hypothetical protein [Verticillium alfalfae VaMs.102]EEY18637.1 conserved hypothetical protein [Verticillium alfalfae VaMs.102]
MTANDISRPNGLAANNGTSHVREPNVEHAAHRRCYDTDEA